MCPRTPGPHNSCPPLPCQDSSFTSRACKKDKTLAAGHPKSAASSLHSSMEKKKRTEKERKSVYNCCARITVVGGIKCGPKFAHFQPQSITTARRFYNEQTALPGSHSLWARNALKTNGNEECMRVGFCAMPQRRVLGTQIPQEPENSKWSWLNGL